MFSLWSLEWLTSILSLKNSLLHLGQGNFLPCISASFTLPWSTSWCWCSSDLVLKTLTHLLHLNTILDLWSYLKCSWSSISLYLKTEHPEMLQTNLCTSLTWLSQSACFTKRLSHWGHLTFLCLLFTCMLHSAIFLKMSITVFALHLAILVISFQCCWILSYLILSHNWPRCNRWVFEVHVVEKHLLIYQVLLTHLALAM